MKFAHFAQALLSLVVASSPITGFAAPKENVRVGNGNDSLMSRSSTIKDDDTIMVIPELDEKMALLRVVGDPGPGQPQDYVLHHCEQHPKGGLVMASCRKQGSIALNQTVDILPGYYVIDYAGSTHHFTLRESEKLEIKLTKLYYPERITSAGLRLSFVRDMTNPSEFEKAVREIGGGVIQHGGAAALVINMVGMLACLSSELANGKDDSFEVEFEGGQSVKGDEAQKLFRSICRDRDRSDVLKTSFKGQLTFLKPALGSTMVIRPEFTRSSWNVMNFKDTDKIVVEVKSDHIQSGEFVSVLPGAYGIGFKRADEGSQRSFKGGVVVSDRSEKR